MEKYKLMLVAGARPNFMKIAPIVRRLMAQGVGRRDKDLHWRLVHTGQHYDDEMSALFFRDLEIPKPDINLGVGSASHAVQTARIMERFEKVCLDIQPGRC